MLGRQLALMEELLRRQLLLNHRLDHDQRELEQRLLEVEALAESRGRALGQAETQLASHAAAAAGVGSGDTAATAAATRELEERLAQAEAAAEVGQREAELRLRLEGQLAAAQGQLRERGETIGALTASLERAAKQLSDADTRLDLAWSSQSVEYSVSASAGRAAMNTPSRSPGIASTNADRRESTVGADQQQQQHQQLLRRQLLLNHRLDHDQRELERWLLEVEALAESRGRALGEAGGGSGDTAATCTAAAELEERLAQAEVDAEVGQREAELRLRLEGQLAAAQNDTERAETAAFTMSRKLAAALRAQRDSAKLIARLRRNAADLKG